MKIHDHAKLESSQKKHRTRPRLRNRYQLEFVGYLVGKSPGAVRKAMYRSGLPLTVDGFRIYVIDNIDCIKS